MAKEKSVNPAQLQHKREKQQQLRKHRAEKQKNRDERLSKRDPGRIQSQIEELKELESKGKINAHDARLLKSLESDIARIKKVRGNIPIIVSDKTKQRDRNEQQNEKPLKLPKDPRKSVYYDPVYNPKGAPPPGMPYREWSDEEQDSSGSTDEEVRKIPLPPGTPPPLSDSEAESESEPESEPETRDTEPVSEPHEQSKAPAVLEYSSAPVLRDLRKDAIRMMPSAIRKRKADAIDAPRQTPDVPTATGRAQEDHVDEYQKFMDEVSAIDNQTAS